MRQVETINNRNALAGIKEIAPLTKEDLMTLAEIREVLRKRNSLDRFGIKRNYTPFEINDDEIMVETTWQANGRHGQTIRPMKRSDLRKKYQNDPIEITNWTFTENDLKESQGCVPSPSGHDIELL